MSSVAGHSFAGISLQVVGVLMMLGGVLYAIFGVFSLIAGTAGIGGFLLFGAGIFSIVGGFLTFGVGLAFFYLARLLKAPAPQR